MNNTTPEAKEVFLSALECTSPEDLTRYLDEACRGDATLRERVPMPLTLGRLSWHVSSHQSDILQATGDDDGRLSHTLSGNRTSSRKR